MSDRSVKDNSQPIPAGDASVPPVRPFLLAGRFLLLPPPFHETSASAVTPATTPELSVPMLSDSNLGWQAAGRWLPVWGLGIGFLYALAFGLCWRFFGEYQGIRWIPAAALLVTDMGLLGHRLLVGAAILAVSRRHLSVLPIGAMLTVVLVAIFKFALFASLPIGIWQSGSGGTGTNWGDVVSRLSSLNPSPIYRPIILMPLWGRWAMLMALSIGRTAANSPERLRRMAGGSSISMIFSQWLLCTILTVIWCSGSSHHLARPVLMALGVFIVTYLAGFVLAHRFKGQTEATIAATGLVGELWFLILYISLFNAIYWY